MTKINRFYNIRHLKPVNTALYSRFTYHVYRIPAVVSQPDRHLHSHRQGHTLHLDNCRMLDGTSEWAFISACMDSITATIDKET